MTNAGAKPSSLFFVVLLSLTLELLFVISCFPRTQYGPTPNVDHIPSTQSLPLHSTRPAAILLPYYVRPPVPFFFGRPMVTNVR